MIRNGVRRKGDDVIGKGIVVGKVREIGHLLRAIKPYGKKRTATVRLEREAHSPCARPNLDERKRVHGYELHPQYVGYGKPNAYLLGSDELIGLKFHLAFIQRWPSRGVVGMAW